MQTASFDYAPPNGWGQTTAAVSVFADRPHVRGAIVEDLGAAGLSLAQAADLIAGIGNFRPRSGEIVLVDCPCVDARVLAGLTQLDMEIAKAGARLIVSTGMEALEDVFACLDQSEARILVDPNRGEYLIAIGEQLANLPHMKVSDLSGEDRVQLLRLSEQVAEIARRLGAGDTPSGVGSAFSFRSPTPEFRGGEEDTSHKLKRHARPPLPDPRLVRQIIRQRQARARFFDGDLFADPAWDILLDLTAARAEHERVSVTSLCIASGVPPTTALRWIKQMIEAGLLQRIEDEQDKRRAFIALSDKAADAMARYFAEIGKETERLV